MGGHEAYVEYCIACNDVNTKTYNKIVPSSNKKRGKLILESLLSSFLYYAIQKFTLWCMGKRESVVRCIL